MSYTVRRFEDTPNPNAVKCVLDRAVVAPGAGSRSFRNAQDAASDPLAAALFATPGVTNILMCDNWISVGKSPDAPWARVKAGVTKALAKA
ncbi:MAG: scaffolding protein [Phycisphaerales bacterium]|nr:MAG: scaffolding protein [Phycisphaerales bacterium]